MRASLSDRSVRTRALLLTALAAAGAMTGAPLTAQDASIVSKTVTLSELVITSLW